MGRCLCNSSGSSVDFSIRFSTFVFGLQDLHPLAQIILSYCNYYHFDDLLSLLSLRPPRGGQSQTIANETDFRILTTSQNIIDARIPQVHDSVLVQTMHSGLMIARGFATLDFDSVPFVSFDVSVLTAGTEGVVDTVEIAVGGVDISLTTSKWKSR